MYRAFYGPRNTVRHILHTGVRKHIEIEIGRTAMKKAADRLVEKCGASSSEHMVYFLTGQKYWYQTAFCLYSLQQYAPFPISGVFIDDGTFDRALCAQVRKSFPSSRIILKEEIAAQLDLVLPNDRFPTLRNRRLVYPHIRKLTDVHIFPTTNPKLVLDSDMLFFKRPAALIHWLEYPDHLLFLEDVVESYGYTRELMAQLSGQSAVPLRLNVGVAGMPSECISWDELETWTAELLFKEGSSYLQEQALTAMIAAKWPYAYLDSVNYKVCPRISDTSVPEILHHYVADSKYDYFVKGWKQIFQESGAASVV